MAKIDLEASTERFAKCWLQAEAERKFRFVTEHKFHDKRKFRFDIAFLPEKVAVELDGAVFTQGRHTRGKGFIQDCVKKNLAAELGWVVLVYPVKTLNDNPQEVIEQVIRVLELRQKQLKGTE